MYAKASQAVIVYGTGITQHAHGADSTRALANLAILTGRIENGAGDSYALQRENNAQGACDMGALPDFLPGYQSVSDTQVRKRFEKQWGMNLPSDSGLTAIEIIEQAKKGKIKGLYIVGENPVLSFPHSNLITETLASLDFLVVQDMFLTETARLATVVLPAASFAEKEGTFTNFEGRVNRVRKAVEPIGESLPDGEIILRLANKMDFPLPFSSLQQVSGEIEEVVSRYRGQFLDGFTRFSPVEYIPPVDGAKQDYPFTLLTGALLYHLGSGTRSSKAWRLKKFAPQAFLEIGVADAKRIGISDGDKVKVTSALGELTSEVRITDTLPEGTLFMPLSLPEAPVNGLFDITMDAEAKTPSLKACNVRIERVGLDG
jgi:predicted molibdopterin-dependent oxidoreductase YjgC